MHISQRTIVAVTALVFALAAYAQRSEAQQASPQPLRVTAPAPRLVFQEAPPAQATATGELLDVDAKANTLTIKTENAEMTFSYDDKTKVTGAQKGVAGLATMTGSKVTIQYKKDGQTNLATSIEIRAEEKG